MDQSSPNRPSRHSRTWSHRSDKSSASKTKDALAESPADKKRRDSFWKGASKANPNAAVNEAQPADAALFEKATIESLRSVQHRDRDGNVITDPDLSNPTRSRWERPLDTIRSFDKNIEAGYKRRSISRSESYEPREQFASRRSSYYGGPDNRFQSGSSVTQYHGGYYGAQRRPDGLMDDGSSPPAPPSRNRFNQFQRAGTMTRSHTQGYNNYDSYENGMNSDSTGPWNNSTDPSSENSSIDRAHAAVKAQTPQGPDGYGYQDGFGNGVPIMEEYDSGSDGYGMSRRANNNNMGVPPVPGHAQQQSQSQAPPARAPIQLGGGGGVPASLPSMARKPSVKEEKKKGFFKKRFSKG